MRGIDFLLPGGSVHFLFLFRYYILIKNYIKHFFWIFTMDSDMIIYCLTKLVKLFILEMLKKMRAYTF